MASDDIRVFPPLYSAWDLIIEGLSATLKHTSELSALFSLSFPQANQGPESVDWRGVWGRCGVLRAAVIHNSGALCAKTNKLPHLSYITPK